MIPFNPEEFSREEIPLIPDQQEYLEAYIDEYLEWIAKDNPTSPFKNEEMLKAHYNTKFFKNRRQELERECFGRLKERRLQYQAAVDELEKTVCPLSTVDMPAHQVKAQTKQWRDEEKIKLKTRLDEDLEWIRGEVGNVMRQCEEQVTEVQQRYNEAYQRWKQESSHPGGNLGNAA